MSTKRKFGDRRDGHWVRDVPGLQTIMTHLMHNRTECEVYMNDTFDVTDVLKFIEKKNLEHPEYKTTLFHCFIYGAAKMIRERPNMNRFIQGRRMYQRDDISLSFVCKRRYTDHAEEALMVMVAKDEQNIDDVTKKIVGDVIETRKSEHSTGGIDAIVDALAKLPRFLLAIVVGLIRLIDYWGISPSFLTDGDPNFTTVFFSNLGSIKGPAIYHHLNNYGTNSIMVTVGTIHKAELIMPDGTKQIRNVVDIGATLDERIGDGFYFVRSLKLLKYLFAHPELMEQPLGEPSGFDYK